MEIKEQIYIATIAIYKGFKYEELYYSDYLYGKESYSEQVWEYVLECEQIGRKAFKEKYSEFDMHPNF